MGKKLLFAFLLFASVCFVTADSLFGILMPEGETVSVPDFCGMQEETLAIPDWAALQTEYRYDDAHPAGIVIGQTPAPGSPYKISDRRPCELVLTVSLGAERLEVPAVCGKDAREAAGLLRQSGFAVQEETAAGGKAGTVARTDPPAGAQLAPGGTVTIYICAGERAQTVTVPDLIGMSRGNALMQIFLSGLSAGEVTEEISDAPDGTVIRHSPAAGSLVAPGTRIRLVISRRQNTEAPEDAAGEQPPGTASPPH